MRALEMRSALPQWRVHRHNSVSRRRRAKIPALAGECQENSGVTTGAPGVVSTSGAARPGEASLGGPDGSQLGRAPSGQKEIYLVSSGLEIYLELIRQQPHAGVDDVRTA